MGHNNNFSRCGNNKAVLTELKSTYTIAVYNTEGGYCGDATLATWLTFFQENYTNPSYIEQTIAPQDGATVQVNDNSQNTYLNVNGTGTYAILVIKLPLNTNLADGQEILVTTKEAVTALTFNLNSVSTMLGTLSALTAGQSFRLRYSKDNDRWATFS